MKYVAFLDVLGFKKRLSKLSQYGSERFISSLSSLLYKVWEEKGFQDSKECLCLVKKQNQNTSIDSSLPLFRSLKELAKICYNFQNSRTFDVAKPLYIMKGGLERYGFGRTI